MKNNENMIMQETFGKTPIAKFCVPIINPLLSCTVGIQWTAALFLVECHQ